MKIWIVVHDSEKNDFAPDVSAFASRELAKQYINELYEDDFPGIAVIPPLPEPKDNFGVVHYRFEESWCWLYDAEVLQ